MIESRELKLLFPTPVVEIKISDMHMLDSLKNSLHSLKKNNDGVIHNTFFWQSHDNIMDRPEFLRLKALIAQETNSVLDELKVVRDGFYINNMWGNIALRSHSHMEHIHPNSYISGLLYINIPKGSSRTVFSDPRGHAPHMIEPDYSVKNTLNAGVEYVDTEKGRMLIWQSWLPHSVEPLFYKAGVDPEDYSRDSLNDIDNCRISIAWTIMLIANSTVNTSKINWK
jgi:uncharacterized protein (TIGR02466 family)